MATAADIGWGKYRSYEGTFYRGKSRYFMPPEPTEAHRIMNVITATEGGRFDAWNGYDRCGWTSGLIQWCEKGMYGISRMLGDVAEKDPSLMAPVDKMALNSGYQFQKDSRGRWRFHKDDNPVDTAPEQIELFFKEDGANGKKGTWTPEIRQYAKEWAAAISSVWENKTAQEVQTLHTAKRLMGFAMPYAKKVLKSAPNTNVGNAFTAAYLSFAANNPTWASRHLKIAISSSVKTRWTEEWLADILNELTFGPKVTIYPHRYNAIRPILEKVYKIDLPDFAKELKQWRADQPHGFFYDTKEIQEGYLTLGLDLGPWGADGKWGDKTTEQTLIFEKMDYGEPTELKVPEEHIDGMMDQFTAKKLEWVLERKGIELLT